MIDNAAGRVRPSPSVRVSLARAFDAVGLALLAWLQWRLFFDSDNIFDGLGLMVGLAGIAGAWLSRSALALPFSGALAIYLSLTLLSAAVHGGLSPQLAWSPSSHALVLAVFAIGAAWLLRTRARVGAAIVGLVAWINVIGVEVAYDHLRYGIKHRFLDYGSVQQWTGYIPLGMLFALALPLTIAAVLTSRSWTTIVAASMLTALLLLDALGVYSRGAYLCIAFTYVVLSIVEIRQLRTWWLFGAAAAGTAVLAAAVVIPSGLSRALIEKWSDFWYRLPPNAWAFSTRFVVWQEALSMIRAHPWLGVGPGLYTEGLRSGFVDAPATTDAHAHSTILHVAAEIGIPGVLAFLFIWWVLIRGSFRAAARPDVRVYAFALLGSLVAFLSRSVFDHLLGGLDVANRMGFLLWMLFAATAAIIRLPPPLESDAAATPRAVRTVFALGVLAALGIEALVLFRPASIIRAAGRQPFVVTEFAQGVPIGETFRAATAGLNSADVLFSTDEPASVRLTCRLMTWGDYVIDHWMPLYEWTTTVQLPRGTSWQRFPFRPVAVSKAQIYQFQVQLIEARAADSAGARPSVGVIASNDSSLEEGNLIVGPTQVIDKDLFFTARAADSVFADFRRRVNPELPKPLRSYAFQLSALAICTWALAVFAYYMVVRVPRTP